MNMRDLFVYFKAYIRNNLGDSIWILCFSVFIFCIVKILMRKQENEPMISMRTSNIVGAMLSLEYSFVFVMTLFDRKVIDNSTSNISVFAPYIKVYTENDTELLLQIIMNITMFIPMGFLMPCCFGVCKKYRWVILITFILSLSIECIQGICCIGYFELNDILNNVIGAMIGISIYSLYSKIKKEKVDNDSARKQNSKRL